MTYKATIGTIRLKERGDYLTLGTGVCVLKEAAHQLAEQEV